MLIPECAICGGRERYYSFVVGSERFDQCRDCGLLSHKALKGVETTDVVEFGTGNQDRAEPGLMAGFFSLLRKYVGAGDRHIGITGRDADGFVGEAQRHGFEASVITIGDQFAGVYDIVLAVNVLEDSPTPVVLAEALRRNLRVGGTVAVITRQLVKPGWQPQSGDILEPRQRYSFSETNLQTVLWKAGFTDVFLSHYGRQKVDRPQDWSKDQMIAFGRMRERRVLPRLSVVVPVFNEVATARRVLDALAEKQMPGIELEIIVVESASTDGTRELVLGYQEHPRFRIVLEERPRGKGFAVRNGIRHATGEVILIQDADLEYDILDYDMLIGPVFDGKAAFVLGTRHAGTWKIRRFSPVHLAFMINLVHWMFVFALNLLYRQSMTDPFTMFKVFRADCLSGIDFECDGFDFDWELVCKLLRKGYTPLEIPVNYRARSFQEGKKINLVHDALTGIRAMLKYRSSVVHRIPAARSETEAPPNLVRAIGL